MEGLTASSPSPSPSPSPLSLPPKPKLNVTVIKKLIQELERGQKSADMMRNIILEHYSSEVKLEGFSNNNDDDDYINNNQDYLNAFLDHHSMVALDTYTTSLSILENSRFDVVSSPSHKLLLHHANKDLASSPHKLTRRDCNKRRKNGESREEEVTQLRDDGFGWRKYGQKRILTYKHPREYYRCTHKLEQKCKATKQVQQISDHPTKYKIIYHDRHTCNNNILETTPFIMDSPEQQSSAIVVTFDGSNQINPLLFPTSAFPNTTLNQNKDQLSYNYCPISPSLDDISISTTTNQNHVSLQSKEVPVVDDYGALMVAASELFSNW